MDSSSSHDSSDEFIYVNNLTRQQSAPATRMALCTLLSSSSTNPRVVGLKSPVYKAGWSEWKLAEALPDLRAASSLFYYIDDLTNEVSRNVVCVSELVRLMRDGIINGMTMITSSTYPVEGNDKWSNLSHPEMLELKQVVQMLSRNSGGAASSESDGKTLQDETDMVFRDGEDEELRNFLTSTEGLAKTQTVAALHKGGEEEEEEEDEEEQEDSYVSDGGTTYVKVPGYGEWVNEEDLPPHVRAARMKKKKKKSRGGNVAEQKQKKPPSSKSAAGGNRQDGGKEQKSKKRKSGFTAKKAAKWIYVTGLPMDTNEEEVAAHFSKAGVFDISPDTLLPRIKLYRDKESNLLKGDASICYANEASVDLAITVLHDGFFRMDGTSKLSVGKASFKQKGDTLERDGKMDRATLQKRKMAKLAAAQAVSWDAGANGRIAGGAKGLTIVVLKNAFTREELEASENDAMSNIEKAVVDECAELGSIEKITVFSKSRESVVTVKFKEVEAANNCVERMNGKADWRGLGLRLKCHFWDGVTDYTNRNDAAEEAEEKKRLDEFGDWLESQELPDELKPRDA